LIICADFGGLRMNDSGALFIRQEQHQKLRIVEFVLKKLGINNLSEREFEEANLVILHIAHSSALFEECFPRSVVLSSIIKTISTL
jgi:hypothetical protein